MALVFNNIQPAVAQTHVFIIGVGGYPYLPGGNNAIPQTFAGAEALGQLTSPPVSAEAFYNTVIEFHNNNAWINPLGSVEVLVSPALGQNVFAGMALEKATMQNITNAYWIWKARCDANPNNIAIFFFCGHGMEKDNHFLLPEDFGVQPGNPWAQCIDIDNTRRAFHSCKAATQIFFIDACRLVPADLIMYEITAIPIEPPNIFTPPCKYDLTMKAAAANEAAFGSQNQPSVFTRTLIKALKGKASDKKDGQWTIETGILAARINRLMEFEMPGEGYPQRCTKHTSDTAHIIRFAEPPVVPLNISCQPDQALPLAQLVYENTSTHVAEQRNPEPTPWSVDVRAGIYKLQAKFQNGQYVHDEVLEYIAPPFSEQKLLCK